MHASCLCTKQIHTHTHTFAFPTKLTDSLIEPWGTFLWHLFFANFFLFIYFNSEQWYSDGGKQLLVKSPTAGRLSVGCTLRNFLWSLCSSNIKFHREPFYVCCPEQKQYIYSVIVFFTTQLKSVWELLRSTLRDFTKFTFMSFRPSQSLKAQVTLSCFWQQPVWLWQTCRCSQVVTLLVPFFYACHGCSTCQRASVACRKRHRFK